MLNTKIIHIVKRLKNGEQNAFDELYELTKTSVYYSAWSIVRRDQLAEDIMQETYIAFINNLQNLSDERNYYYYLLTIAKNKALNELKKNSQQVFVEDIETVGGETEDSSDSTLLELCKSKLSEDEWYLIEQCVVLGYKRIEVAKKLNKPIATVNWQYNKALSKAKKLYKEVYDEK